MLLVFPMFKGMFIIVVMMLPQIAGMHSEPHFQKIKKSMYPKVIIMKMI